MKHILFAAVALIGLSACDDAATVASRNLSQAADNFQINRRIVFYNGITNEYILTIEGLCALGHGAETKSVTVTCQTGRDSYKKYFLGLSDNVTYVAEQLDDAKVSAYHYRVLFRPQTIIPSIGVDVKVGG